ncbi:MAG: hypothetical protein ACXWC6_08580 [Ramlibacter sp.]
MDPVIANLDLDPPASPSPLRRGLLPALLVHAVFFAALALSLQWKGSGDDELAARSDTRVMGAPPAPPPEQAQPPAAEPPATLQTPAAAEPTRAASKPADAASAARVPVPAQAPARAAPAARPAASGAGASRDAREPPRSGAALKPSFDCAKARSRNERAICSDPELARLDRDTGRLHARARAAARDPAAFRRQNDREWKQRETACHDKDCLLAWYAHRRQQLQQILAQAR